ncbi:MAG: cation transporter [Verrucomicrobia bacterium]|nr:cation transporter [Verrucomicrobiota bacterium]
MTMKHATSVPETTEAKSAVAALSVLASGSLAVLKFVVGLLTGSLGILAEAAHSLLDLVSTLITLLVVRVAAVPPDLNHPYGHERAENLGALAGMTLLAAAALIIAYHAALKIVIRPEPPDINVWSFAVLLASLMVDFLRARSLRQAAREHGSQALASDAEHFTNDMVSAFAVLIGLAVVALARAFTIPAWLVGRADAIAGLVVAAIALRSVWRLGSAAVRALMDDVPPTLTGRLKDQVENVAGVVKGSARVRARFVGSRPYVEVSLGTPRGGSLESAHEVSERVEQVIAAELAGAHATVHVEPMAAAGEGPAAAVRAIADRLGLRVHNLHVYVLSAGTKVELDLELNEELSLQEAHRYSESLEAAAHRELPGPLHLNVHLEPRDDRPRPAVRQDAARVRVEAALRQCASDRQLIIGDVLATDDGWIVTVTEVFAPATSLKAAHEAMTGLEGTIRAAVPEVVRVHVDPEVPVHAAPAKDARMGAPDGQSGSVPA